MQLTCVPGLTQALFTTGALAQVAVKTMSLSPTADAASAAALIAAVRVCEIHGLEGRDRRERGRGKIRAELAAADDRERFRVLARKVFCADGGRRAGAQCCDRTGVQKRLRLAGGKIKEERRAEKRRERLFRVRVIP